MAEQFDPKELVSFKELLMANAIQIDAAVQFLIEKGFFTEVEYFSKLKKVQGQYEKRQRPN
jgi:ribulose bisphosphate carboxylase small subunit